MYEIEPFYYVLALVVGIYSSSLIVVEDWVYILDRESTALGERLGKLKGFPEERNGEFVW